MRRTSGRGAGQVDEDKRHQNRKDLSLSDQTGNIEASFSKVKITANIYASSFKIDYIWNYNCSYKHPVETPGIRGRC